jgi:methylated-DNA-[protein]-cysteine S-methyltransferase
MGDSEEKTAGGQQAGVMIECAVFKTSFGWAGVASSERGISGIVLPKTSKKAAERELKGAGTQRNRSACRSVTGRAMKLLRRYFSGERVSFDVPLDMRYYTSFQQAVWKAASGIPYGETRSYAWIAKRIKNPGAVRAVGQALGANPVPVLIPCHRVISSSGSRGGYSGGIGMKKKLLELEKDIDPRAQRDKSDKRRQSVSKAR